jgi:hypothetical protein
MWNQQQALKRFNNSEPIDVLKYKLDLQHNAITFVRVGVVPYAVSIIN